MVYSKKLIPFLVLVLFLAGLFYFNYRSDIYNAVDPENSENISFQIKKGESVKEIAKNLEEKNLINSEFSFYLYTKWHSLGEHIIAGRFVLNQAMNVPEILKTISDPAQAEYIITIQEGLTIRDIDQKLVKLSLTEPGQFIMAVKNFDGWEYYKFLDSEKLKTLDLPLEGYLYPDTYFLDPATFEPQDLIYLALDNFENKISEISITTGEVAEKYSFHEILTMASIIENEVFGKPDREIVSGILWKRLENSWPIGADATLLYITDDRKIDAADLEIDSPYNTRKNLGLPPSPISNPSIESILAALTPKPSEYWFYLTTLDTGEVIYAKTNEEHNINRSNYL